MRQRGFAGGLPSTGRPPRTNSLSGILARNPSFQQKISDGDTTIKNTGLYQKVYSKKEKQEEPKFLITVYYPPSEITYKDLAPKTMKYWNVLPTANLYEVAQSMAVCVPSPTRLLTDGEVNVLKSMGKHRKMFIFPGTNTTIYNEVLDQLECIFEIIPFSTTPTGGVNGILTTGELMYLPVTLRGWLRVRNKYASLAIAKDPYGKGMAFDNIIHVVPAYHWPDGDGGVYETGYIWDEGTIALTDLHYGGSAYGFQYNTLYTTYPDNWTTLTKAEVLAWLYSIQSHMPYMKKTEENYVIHRNAEGWIDFTDIAEFDWISATLAYYIGDGIMTAGFTPYWLTAAYNTIYDSTYTTKQFSKWWAYKKWGTTNKLAQYFYNMPPYTLYDDTYIPPIQS